MNMRPGILSSAISIILGLVGLWLIPFIFEDSKYLNLINIIGIYSIAVMGLNLLLGITGILSLGHAAFFGLGGYISVLTAIHLHVNPFISIVLSCLAIFVLAALIAIPFTKLSELYLALVTLGFGVILFTLINSGKGFTGGPNGLSGFPPLSIGSFVFRSEKAYFYLIWLFVIAIGLLLSNLLKSRIGRALKAIHSDEGAAASMGVHIQKLKVISFSVGSTIAAFAGSLLAYYFQFISPSTLSMSTSIDMIIMSYLGGTSSIVGAIIGAAVFQYIPELLLKYQEWELLIHGIILLVIILFFPGGIYKGIVKVTKRLRIFVKDKKRGGSA